MHPNHRLSFSLLASLVLWAPTLRASLAGDIDVLSASLRWVAAFVVATIGVTMVTSLLHAYQPAPVESTTTDQATAARQTQDA